MSGSDPSVGRPGGGGGDVGGVGGGGAGGPGGGGGIDACPGPDFQTAVGSPVPEVVEDLATGDVLDLVAVDEQGVRGVLFVTDGGQEVGALVTDILRIRSCMAEGWNYEAAILRKAGGSIVVKVRSADG